MEIRKAVLSDTETIYSLIENYASKGQLLHRSRESIFINIQSLVVVVFEKKVIGVAGLHILDYDLGEIRSLVVSSEFKGKGIGRQLVEKIIEEGRSLGITRLISLTYQVDFFLKCGFRIVNKESLPQKVWRDCINCIKFPVCDETAMLFEF